jgi:hypothetical protein
VTLEGWRPEIGPYLTLAEVIEHAFDYRGNVTVVGRDGSELVGYLFNREAGGPDPFVELIDETGERRLRLRYADIASIRFTGRDTAAGNSWTAWLERKERDRADRAAAPGP